MNLCPLATGFPEQLSADNLAIMALMMTKESLFLIINMISVAAHRQYDKIFCKTSEKTMLSILYPKEDYTAADVAVRVQALAAGEGQKIQVVPKHFGRNPQQVEKQLKQTAAALFIACDKLKLDADSKQELAVLQEKKRKIICVVPQRFAGLPKDDADLERHAYTRGNAKSFTDTVQSFVKKLETSQPAKKRGDKDAQLLIAGGLLVAGIILLAGLNKKK